MDKNLEYEPVRGAHILMIVNPVSGRIGGEHTADKLEAWLKENGAAVDRFETTETENGSGYTAKPVSYTHLDVYKRQTVQFHSLSKS